ncbi:MAG: PKD domain-containing protein [Bdellovibrio sp.]|nr:PKD domain-containing protein [Bdellovibrio sp.]
MGSKQLLLGSLLLLTLAMSCQKSGSAASNDFSVANGLSANSDCADLSAGNDGSLQVNGASKAEVGHSVTYKVNKKVCGSTETIDWNLGGSKDVQTAESVVVSSFTAAGNYVVSAKVANSVAAQKTVIVSKAPALNGPQVVQINVASTFELVVPTGFTVASSSWNFGDGSAASNGAGPIAHTFSQTGLFTLNVAVRDANNTLYSLSQSVNVFADATQVACLNQASISSPTEANINTAVTISGFIPACLKGDVTATKFSYGDGTTGTDLSADHTYSAVGSYSVVLDISSFFQDNPALPYLRLSQTIQVIDPNQNCPALNDSRTTYSDPINQSAVCGLNGSKTQVFKTKVVEQCQSVQGSLTWTEVSRTSELQSEGSCQGQSCALPDKSVLADGASKVLYSSVNPVGTCESASSTRLCSNGVLSGSDTFNSAVCHDGCGDFGNNGTVKTGVVVGETKTEIKCSFNETGFFSTFNQIADKQCVDGQIVTSNTRQGDLKSADACPAYQWVATENWSTCSADCGGVQSRSYVCQDSKNAPATDDRCTTAKPSESRACDGNPAAVGRVERTSVDEEGGSSVTCPANQIGVVTQDRTATTIKTYACIDHAVKIASTTVEYTPWETHKYCRDYVAYRCSQDSLDNTHAVARYNWLLKCESSVPVIKEFLTNFADIKGNNKYTVDSKARVLYPTFMVRSNGKEKVWIAPTVVTAACTVPAGAYIAGVCVSSCATPEQQILVESKEERKKMKYASFIDSLTSKTASVGTLGLKSTLDSKTVQATLVDQWVTEMLDTEHVILEFHMKSGRSLRLTPNHPVVSKDGSVKLAETFKAGDSLVQLGGALDEIKSIKETKYFGKVYNLFVKSSEPLENIVVTNGYLNGTAFFQNEGSDNINRVILRKKLTQGVFNK